MVTVWREMIVFVIQNGRVLTVIKVKNINSEERFVVTSLLVN